LTLANGRGGGAPGDTRTVYYAVAMAPAASLLGSSYLVRALVTVVVPSARRLLEVDGVAREHIQMLRSDITGALLKG
jgi:hypothetical protein